MFFLRRGGGGGSGDKRRRGESECGFYFQLLVKVIAKHGYPRNPDNIYTRLERRMRWEVGKEDHKGEHFCSFSLLCYLLLLIQLGRKYYYAVSVRRHEGGMNVDVNVSALQIGRSRPFWLEVTAASPSKSTENCCRRVPRYRLFSKSILRDRHCFGRHHNHVCYLYYDFRGRQ